MLCLGYGRSSLMYDGEQNHFDFSPNITYKGDNQVLNMTDIDDFSNDQQETVMTNVMNSNSFTGSNNFSSTVIPISVNGDGNMKFPEARPFLFIISELKTCR